jgi:TPR repeat protein
MMIAALMILSILAAGIGMTFAAVRLVQQHDQPQTNLPDAIRPIAVVDSDETAEITPMEQAMARLDAPVGHAAVDSTWLASHGKLWYDDKWYRLAWILWPQAIAVLAVLWFWAVPSTNRNVQWAKPVDASARSIQLAALRDAAKASRTAMDSLERDARGGEMEAEFFYGTLFDPNFRLSTIVQPDASRALDWYGKAAAQGHESALNNLAVAYYEGVYARADFTRACFYARKLSNNAYHDGLRVKGNCYSGGLGGTPVDMTLAANAYEASAAMGDWRAEAALGYFYERGVGGKDRNSEIALKHYRNAADKGDALGLHNLGSAYNSGLLGLQRDGAEAARLIMKALEAKYDFTVRWLTTRPEIWTADFWQNLQRRLEERGLYGGPADGQPNPATLDAVRRLGSRT